MEGFDRLDQAIDRRFQIEDAFIQAMSQEFQRIQQELNECIARHPNDPQLALVGAHLEQLGEQSRAIVPYEYPIGNTIKQNTKSRPRERHSGALFKRVGGKRTRRR